MQELNQVLSTFKIKGEVISATPYGNGHINHTHLIVTKDANRKVRRYILQGINGHVFKNAEALMSNIEKVTSFLRKRTTDKRSVMRLVGNENGRGFMVDEDKTCWRVYRFIEGSVCLERPETVNDFYECAYGFGSFQRQLNDFPVETLAETIPDFHNTPKRYRDFLAAVEADVCGRAASVMDEIEFVKSEEAFYSVLYDNLEAGKLPLRVAHNDTKINNVMLDAETRKALCVIDLDTIMPGFSVTDFGDSIRFGANTAAEDEQDISKVSLDIDLFDIYAKGFIEGCGGLLGEDEIMLLPEGAKMMTLECGMRFLTDYLQGDTYFKTKYPEHNLVRSRTQFELSRDMDRHWDELKSIVKKYI